MAIDSNIKQQLDGIIEGIDRFHEHTKEGMKVHAQTIMRLHQICVKHQHALEAVADTLPPSIMTAKLIKDLTNTREDLLKVIPPMTTTGKNTGKKK